MSRPCPCCSKLTYDKCCEPFHLGKKLAPTPEKLMRSRYAAYALAKVDYLMATTAAEEREKLDRADLLAYCKSMACVGLKILKTEGGAEGEETGTVLFHASLQHNGKRVLHRELSRFRKEEGKWVYVDGDTN